MPDSDSTHQKTPMRNFTDSKVLKIHSKLSNFELSPPAKRGQLWIFNIDFDFEDVQSNRFTTVRFDMSIISKFWCYRPSLTSNSFEVVSHIKFLCYHYLVVFLQAIGQSHSVKGPRSGGLPESLSGSRSANSSPRPGHRSLYTAGNRYVVIQPWTKHTFPTICKKHLI